MPKKNNDNESDFANIFHIPANFMDSGRVFGGMFNLRNVVEACAVFLLLVVLEWLILQMGLVIKLVIMGVTILPCAFIALIGIDKDPLSVFLYHVIRFQLGKKIMHLRKVGDNGGNKKTNKKNGSGKGGGQKATAGKTGNRPQSRGNSEKEKTNSNTVRKKHTSTGKGNSGSTHKQGQRPSNRGKTSGQAKTRTTKKRTTPKA